MGRRSLTEQWWFSIILAVMLCFAVGATAAAAGVLRRRFGDRRLDAVGGLLIVLFIAYVIVGIGYALYTLHDIAMPIDYPDDEPREFIR